MTKRRPVAMAAFVWDAFVLHAGDAIVTEMHAVATVQLVVGLGSHVVVQTPDGERLEAPCVVVAPNARHALGAARFAMLWIEAESDAGRRLVASYCRRRSIASVPLSVRDELAREVAAILEDPRSCDAAWKLSNDLLTAAAGELPRAGVAHPAIRKAVRIIETRPHAKISARELALEVGLSTSRLTHLFRETLGVPLRRFAMWQRLRGAIVVLARGGSASEAAHDAGFTDLAHLNRVLKMMLGVQPSDFQAFRRASNLTLRVCARPRRGSPQSTR